MGKILPGAEAVCCHGDSDLNRYLCPGPACLSSSSSQVRNCTSHGWNRVGCFLSEQSKPSARYGAPCVFGWPGCPTHLFCGSPTSAPSDRYPCGTPQGPPYGEEPWGCLGQQPRALSLHTWELSGLVPQCVPHSHPGGFVQSGVEPMRNRLIMHNLILRDTAGKGGTSEGKGKGCWARCPNFPSGVSSSLWSS